MSDTDFQLTQLRNELGRTNQILLSILSEVQQVKNELVNERLKRDLNKSISSTVPAEYQIAVQDISDMEDKS